MFSGGSKGNIGKKWVNKSKTIKTSKDMSISWKIRWWQILGNDN